MANLEDGEQSKKATKDWNCSTGARKELNGKINSSLHHNPELSRFDDAIRESSPSDYTISVPFDDTVWRG